MRLAPLAFLGPLIFLLLADGRPQKDNQWDERRIKIATVSNEEDSEEKLKPITTELSSSEFKKLSKLTFNSLISDGHGVEIQSSNLRPKEKKENHRKKNHHHHREFADFLGGRQNGISPEDKCMASPFSQLVHVAGCESKFVLNRFCHGSCSSFYIPQLRSRKLKANFENFTVCRPSEVEHVKIRLECEDGHITREITRIKRCACVEHGAPLPE